MKSIEHRIEEYRRRDYRTRCMKCRRWMRKKPTAKTPTLRQKRPNAEVCVDCFKAKRKPRPSQGEG